MSAADKAQEWTAERVGQLGLHLNDYQREKLSEAINAALDAAYRQGYNDCDCELNGKKSDSTTGDIIDRLRYIADSPPSEHGGFHPNAIQTAKDAITVLAAVCKVSQDSQRALWEATKQLAAEREKRIQEDKEWERSKQRDLTEIQQLREQLAAEREQAALDYNNYVDTIQQLQLQLDDERERTEQFARAQAKANARLCEIEDEHQQQLAAEREKVRQIQNILDLSDRAKLGNEVIQLRKELAAAADNSTTTDKNLGGGRETCSVKSGAATDPTTTGEKFSQIQQLRDQLAAERVNCVASEWTAGHDGTGRWGIYHGNETKKGWSGKGRLLVDGLLELQARQVEKGHNAVVAAVHKQLAAAQAAVREVYELNGNDSVAMMIHAKEIMRQALNGDTTALDAAIAEARQPLVDALNKVDLCLERLSVRHGTNHSDVLDINNTRHALAKVKEGK